MLTFFATAVASFSIVWGFIEAASYFGFTQLQNTGWKGMTVMVSTSLNVAGLITWCTFLISERPVTPAPSQLGTVLRNAGISGFFSDREHYKLRGDGLRSIASYINLATINLTLVSVSFVTGRDYEGTLNLLRNKLEERTDFELTISLLNPDKLFLLDALAANFGKNRNDLRSEIRNGIIELTAFRNSLSPGARSRCHVRLHNSIPFASAIIMDTGSESAKIQLETKSYKAPYNKSFAIEVMPTEDRNGFYYTLLNSYRTLLSDGQPVIA